jgi:uncharacterized RDD family membrane protein YckC
MSLPSPQWQRNPFAVSPAVLANAQPLAQLALASRPVRMAAHLIDGLILSATLAPAAIGLWLDVSKHLRPNYTITGGLLTLVVGTAWAAFNLHLLSRNGQSIGKRLLSMKVVRRDGSPASQGRIFWLRNFVNGLPQVIPIAGQLHALLYALMIFSQTRPCLHNQIADTQVIRDRRR